MLSARGGQVRRSVDGGGREQTTAALSLKTYLSIFYHDKSRRRNYHHRTARIDLST